MKQKKYDRLTAMLSRMSNQRVEDEADDAWVRFTEGNKPTAADFVIVHTWAMRLWRAGAGKKAK
jgi:hypothetical protein